MSTEVNLIHWRDGQTKAERLCAHILIIEGFSSIDPQCPLGGPDGLKDIVCEKNGWKYIGAAYFPTTEQDFAAIKKKFTGDLEGVAKNGADGIVFLTNQRVSPGERSELESLALTKSHKSLIYHRERIRVVLDSPIGFGIRLEYLGIEMNREEQLGFFAGWRSAFAAQLQQQSDYIIAAISKKIDHTAKPISKILPDINNFIAATQSTTSALVDKITPSKRTEFVQIKPTPSSELTIEKLCELHKNLSDGKADAVKVGELRKVKVWIGTAGSLPENASFIPPPADQVPKLLEELLSQWRSDYAALTLCGDKNEILRAIASFHHRFLSIHPFLDGNGRIARFVLSTQVSELLGESRSIVLEDRQPYFDALTKAHASDLAPLKRVITQAIFGREEI